MNEKMIGDHILRWQDGVAQIAVAPKRTFHTKPTSERD